MRPLVPIQQAWDGVHQGIGADSALLSANRIISYHCQASCMVGSCCSSYPVHLSHSLTLSLSHPLSPYLFFFHYNLSPPPSQPPLFLLFLHLHLPPPLPPLSLPLLLPPLSPSPSTPSLPTSSLSLSPTLSLSNSLSLPPLCLSYSISLNSASLTWPQRLSHPLWLHSIRLSSASSLISLPGSWLVQADLSDPEP